MIKNSLKIAGCLIMALAFTSICFAADTKHVDVLAYIPQQNGLTITVSKVVDTTWTEVGSIDFGSLIFDSDNNIFTAECYYAVDVGINSNAPDWTVTHTVSSIVNGSETLDDNINVVFINQTSDDTGTELDKLTFAESHNQAYTKSQLTAGWLRVYYGVATGEASEDAPNVVPIGATQTFGNYSGQVTLTLTP